VGDSVRAVLVAGGDDENDEDGNGNDGEDDMVGMITQEGELIIKRKPRYLSKEVERELGA
jgi:hypothetical protein